MNIAVWGLNWRHGDEIVTTTHEHEGALLPIYAAARRLGLTVRIVDLGVAESDIVGALSANVTVHSPAEHIGLTAFSLAGSDPEASVAALAERGVVIRSLHHSDGLRVSTGFFNDDDDLDQLRDGLLAITTTPAWACAASAPPNSA